MILPQHLNNRFQPVTSHVRNTSQMVDCTGASVLVIHNDEIVSEEYWGKHSKSLNARHIQEDSQFHVASVRKSYIGFAVAYAVHKGYIHSIDDEVVKYLSVENDELLNQTTIRHLLTHTHGLNTRDGRLFREFPPGTSWAYRDCSIDMLAEIIRKTTGETIAEILSEQVFTPLNFTETGWQDEPTEKLVDVIREPNDKFWSASNGTDGDKKNMYVSTRELAYWGYVHMKQGFINGEQVVPKEMIKLATSIQSPILENKDLPQNGFLWFVKDMPARKTEIGELVPKGSYQILGYTSVAVLVIPQYDVVAVRMFNSYGSTPGYDYLTDIREFGDVVMGCVGKLG
ncbi:serine hydrolase domain-containing protein [Ferdinandcohnia quinoae]|uniref:Beta-lactamase family protein n=1 Tax=Fredinandcohnia quinoae TaxID=2918902 RepID=A0AAW5E7Z4_9BACI|nr:serine hydrolase domain-containing protein [Fredinandcohnia sp. SECRCQ15]MCH1625263.1 beta-lactamase family protein [Fredinandcohnia sp. SECRCQ15]